MLLKYLFEWFIYQRQIFNDWQQIRNTQKTEDWDAQTTKNLDWHELRCSIWVCSSNFINTTSWVKELGAIALPTFKNCRDTLICFLRNILHLKKNSQFFLSLKYKYIIMCNYLNKYTNSNDAHYIRYASLWNL
jgi:hypothetical protein